MVAAVSDQEAVVIEDEDERAERAMPDRSRWEPGLPGTTPLSKAAAEESAAASTPRTRPWGSAAGARPSRIARRPGRRVR